MTVNISWNYKLLKKFASKDSKAKENKKFNMRVLKHCKEYLKNVFVYFLSVLNLNLHFTYDIHISKAEEVICYLFSK